MEDEMEEGVACGELKKCVNDNGLYQLFIMVKALMWLFIMLDSKFKMERKFIKSQCTVGWQ